MNELYLLSTQELLKKLGSTAGGLTQKEAAQRLVRDGFNEIQEFKKAGPFILFLKQFQNIMVGILAGGMGISWAMGEVLDAYAIGAIILINAGVGFIQEYRAEKAVEALKKMTAPFALVERDQKLYKIPARELVAGDLIVLEEGTQIPADAHLVELAQLHTMEASLTGESNPIEKKIAPNKEATSLGDLQNMVFMGTVITQGHGKAIVVQTGMRTEFGQIATMVQKQSDSPSPLQKQLSHLSKMLVVTVLGAIALLFGIAVLTHRDLVEMLLLSISLAVSVIPEGLPAIITLTLAIGVQKIAKENAVIRKLSAAETLGSTTVICTDKTGTLTQNQMTVKVLFTNGVETPIEGIGYTPSPSFQVKNKEAELLLQAAVLCNNASLFEDKSWNISGDPTEGALLTFAKKGNGDALSWSKKWPRKEELIFDSTRKRMSTWNGPYLFTKGGVDSVLEVCTHIQENGEILALTPAHKKALIQEMEKLAKQAYRVLAFAYKEMHAAEKASEKGLTFLGMVGMIDPAREEVKEAIATCEKAHIRVIMITGDHALTAQAIGKQIGLYKEGDAIITGAELEQMKGDELSRRLKNTSIFARVSPHHKVQILEALQAQGHIVAMTGDGVNDAPALKKADIGIAMGITGTDVSKEASDMILMDDNFATIVKTVEKGRVIYRNIKKFIRFLLSANFDEILVISVIFILGGPLPFLPLQILWVNLLTDALPAIALGIDTPEEGIMELKPRDPKISIWKDLIGFSVVAGLLSAGVSLTLYFTHTTEQNLEHFRTLLLTTIVVFELLLVFSVRSTTQAAWKNFTSNRLLLFSIGLSLGLQMLAIYHPFFQKILQTSALSGKDWLSMVSLCLFALGILELWKKWRPAPTTV